MKQQTKKPSSVISYVTAGLVTTMPKNVSVCYVSG
jgi:hypothetical protein